MKIFMTGGTGFVGTYLARRLILEGHEVTILTRGLSGTELKMTGQSYLIGNPTIKGKWQGAVHEHDVIINLAGASIFSRWTPKQKKILLSSRIETTRNLVEALPDSAKHITFFSTSAVGYYGYHEDEELIESSLSGDDFLARLAYDWEKEALKAEAKGARVIITRIGIVLGKKGGALSRMIPLFKYFLGGPLGSGRQWFPGCTFTILPKRLSFCLATKIYLARLIFARQIPSVIRTWERRSVKFYTAPLSCPCPAL